MCPEGATFVGHITMLRAVLDIAQQCRNRVGGGHKLKVVLEHTNKALQGINLLSSVAFLGLDSLRAHIHVTRAQASLELGNWSEAKKDAAKALEYDPTFSEAEYMRSAAENK